MDTLTQQLKNKRIAIFTAETIPSFAGSGRHAFKLATFLTKRQAQAKLICYNYNGALPNSEKKDGVIIKRVLYFNTNYITKLLSLPLLIVGYLWHLLKTDIVIIYGRYLIGYQLIILFGSLLNKKVVFRSTLLGCDDAAAIKDKQRLFWVLNRFIFRRLNCYWALNKAFDSIWRKYIGEYERIMLNVQGVEKRIDNQAVSRQIVNEPLRILSVGILIKRKGYLETFKTLSELNSPFIYTVVGQFQPELAHRSSGTEKEEMRFIYETGKELLGDQIRFVGTVENAHDYYNKNHWLLHGATAEGVPNTILEAMVAGLPVICRSIEGLDKAILQSGINCLQFDSSNELLNLLQNKANDDNLRFELAKNAQNTIEDCTFDKVITDLMRCLYNERK